MADHKERGGALFASISWPIVIALSLVGYATFRYGIDGHFGSGDSSYPLAVGKQAGLGSLAAIAWMVLAACWIGTLVAYLSQRERRRLEDIQIGLDNLSAMTWREFELLVGEIFCRLGYSMQESGLGVSGSGADLTLRRNGALTLVQCKQWRFQRIDEAAVRELYDQLAHHDATTVKIVALGDFTANARHFAQGKPIELIHGEALLAMMREVQSAPYRADLAASA
jgi:restriction system protein